MLLRIFCELNELHFGAALLEPSLKWNSRLSSSAGRFSPGSKKFLKRATIEIASYLQHLPDGDHHIRDTLLHEMVHYYLWQQNRPYGHTPEFHKILKRVGARRFNPVPKVRKAKHLYQCPNCKKTFPARRRLGISACRECCNHFHQGKFSERFRLQMLSMEENIAACGPAPVAVPTIPSKDAPPSTQKVEFFLPPEEIIRRLESLKQMLRKK